MATKARKPQKGWVYNINPHTPTLQCAKGHVHIYSHQVEWTTCLSRGCTCKINPSKVYRYPRRYAVWTNTAIQVPGTFTSIPITSEDTFAGLSTTCVIRADGGNGLGTTSYAVVGQLIAVDIRCFQDGYGQWIQRAGKLNPKDRARVDMNLVDQLGIDAPAPSSDWLTQNATPEMLESILIGLSAENRQDAVRAAFESLPASTKEESIRELFGQVSAGQQAELIEQMISDMDD